MISLLLNLIKKTIYIFFLILIPYFIFIIHLSAQENNFLVKNLKISEEFDLNFSKNKVIDNAFEVAFENLLFRILTSKNFPKIKNTTIDEIKQLVENFKIKDEKFKDDKYFASFDVNFNKKKIFNFLEKNNLFVSIPLKIDVLFLPIFIENNQLFIFNDNIFYSQWVNKNFSNYLINYILPLEDINDFKKYIEASDNLEKLNMKNISEKYNLENYILSLIYKEKNKIKIFSKIKLDDNLSSTNIYYDNVDLKNEVLLNSYIHDLKNNFDDIWKKYNQINTSIKLNLEIILKTNNFDKIKEFENAISEIDLINAYQIKKFDIDKNIYNISYNGKPDVLIKKLLYYNFFLIYNGENWIVK